MRDIINITMGELTTAVDNEVVKAVQKVGIDVDKEELLKALELYHNLVRCGECKKANTSECSLAYWDDDWGKWRIGYAGDNWYCADGEREGE